MIAVNGASFVNQMCIRDRMDAALFKERILKMLLQ